MEYRQTGNSGLYLSELSFGSWITFGNQIDKELSTKLMHTAYDAGVNFFDNAEVYAHGKSEEVMGEILKASNWSRDSYVVSSKVYFGKGGKLPTQRGLNRKHIVEACHDALKRLQVDYLDIYFCHRPDKGTPIVETVWTMHQLIMQGKILYWGTSEWSAQEIMEAHRVAAQNNLIGPIVEQPQYNMLHRDKIEVEYSQIYKTVGLGTTIWSPLASGILTGKYNDGFIADTRLGRDELNWLKELIYTKENIEKVKKLTILAMDIGLTMAQLAILWCNANPNVTTVLLGASKVGQLEENLAALNLKDKINSEIIEEVERILANKPNAPAF
ncbi:MAG: aldo/keto reductase [Crocinitomicaceae bacterium]|nr:aldo/keto reductase [Crocinitomicaceae bacterium]